MQPISVLKQNLIDQLRGTEKKFYAEKTFVLITLKI